MDHHEGEVLLDAERSASRGSLRCVRCGTAYPPGRQDRRSCSDGCRAAASRERQADRVRKMEALIGELAKLTNETEK